MHLWQYFTSKRGSSLREHWRPAGEGVEGYGRLESRELIFLEVSNSACTQTNVTGHDLRACLTGLLHAGIAALPQLRLFFRYDALVPPGSPRSIPSSHSLRVLPVSNSHPAPHETLPCVSGDVAVTCHWHSASCSCLHVDSIVLSLGRSMRARRVGTRATNP